MSTLTQCPQTVCLFSFLIDQRWTNIELEMKSWDKTASKKRCATLIMEIDKQIRMCVRVSFCSSQSSVSVCVVRLSSFLSCLSRKGSVCYCIRADKRSKKSRKRRGKNRTKHQTERNITERREENETKHASSRRTRTKRRTHLLTKTSSVSVVCRQRRTTQLFAIKSRYNVNLLLTSMCADIVSLLVSIEIPLTTIFTFVSLRFYE